MHELSGTDRYDFGNGSIEPHLDIPIVISTEGDEFSLTQQEVDTSHIIAPDDREEETPRVSTDIPRDPPDDKPPVGPTAGDEELPEEEPASPDKKPDEARPRTIQALGEVASDSSEAAGEEILPEGVERRLFGASGSVFVSTEHRHPESVEEAISALGSIQQWAEVTDYESVLDSRHYYVDAPPEPGDDPQQTPHYFVKSTDYERERPNRTPDEGITELALAPRVGEIASSQEAQRIAVDQGFSGISYVTPLAVIRSGEGERQVVVYPFIEGRPVMGAEGLHGARGGAIPGSELDRASTVVDRLAGLFAINGIEANDLRNQQLIVESSEEGDFLHLIDTERYKTIESATPSLPPDQVLHLQEGEPRGISSATADASSLVEVGLGGLAVARPGDEVRPVLAGVATDGYITTLWNADTKEGALMSAPDSPGSIRQFAKLEEQVPSLAQPGVIAHMAGPIEVEPDGTTSLQEPELAFILAEKDVSQISPIMTREPTTVYLHTSDGTVEAFNQAGDRVFTYTPPTPLPSRPQNRD